MDEVGAGVRAHTGALPGGSRYVIEVPPDWNGVLLLCSRPVPVDPGEPPWERDDPLFSRLVGSGYAVAGSGNSIFWPLEHVFDDQPILLDIAGRTLGPPRHTISLGVSIGGIISAGGAQLFPERFSGVLPMCGNLAGAVGNHNRELDIAFVVKTLLAPRTALQLVNIIDPLNNLRVANAVLHAAQRTADGRARLALAAAVGNIPGWHDPTTAEPAPSDFEARQRNQFAWFESVGFLVYFFARKQVELQARGNPSWNTDVDYGRLLETSINCDEVVGLYDVAGLDLGQDLERLGSAARIEADPSAVAYLERNIVFDGDLRGLPVLTMHTSGDGLVTPDHERAYAEVVHAAGQEGLLRQLSVHRAGHCSFTPAEVLTALDALLTRVDSGTWPALAPESLNGAAERLGADANRLDSGAPAAPGFFGFEPPPFRRRHDVRDIVAG